MSDKDKDLDQTLPKDDISPDEEGPAADDAAPEEALSAAAEVATDEEFVADETAAVEEDVPADRESIRVEEPSPVEQPARKGGTGIAWLAVLLAVVALAAVGYTVWQDLSETEDTTAADAYAAVERRLAAVDESRSELAERVAELEALDRTSDPEVDALRRELDERVQGLSGLPSRMSTLESNVASLAGISATARDTWLLAEAEYYMQIANAQLQLANNPHLATLALRMADERVLQLANPALTDVRRALADELAALDVMEKPDIEGVTLTLASLSRVVESLPLATATGADEAPAADEDPEAGSVRRAWSSVKGAMSGLVKVTPPDQAKLTLMTPDAEYFLRNNIALQLQAARLALLRGEQTLFEQTLDDTSALLDDYFDRDSEQVMSALRTIEEIRGSVFTASTPDISGSLRLLRQFRTLNENSQ